MDTTICLTRECCYYFTYTFAGTVPLCSLTSNHINLAKLSSNSFVESIGIGATRNKTLALLVAQAAAEEIAGSGVSWTFAPCLAVPRNERWGRTYEGFSEDPAGALVSN